MTGARRNRMEAAMGRAWDKPPLWPLFAAVAMVGVAAYIGSFSATTFGNNSCRVQVLTSEERIRDAVYRANQVKGDTVAELIRQLKVSQ